MALNVVSSDRLSTNVKTSNLATGLSSKVGKNKNLIINGAMNVAQRGTSSTATGLNTIDRWNAQFAGTDEAITQAQADVTADSDPWNKGFRKCLKLTNGNQTSGAGATDYSRIFYVIEAQDLACSGWDYTSSSSYITLSFWIKSSIAQNFYGYFLTDDGTSQRYAFETGSLTADTWTKVTKKIPGNSSITVNNDNGVGMYVFLWPFIGTDYSAPGTALNTWAAYAAGTRTPDATSTWWTTNDATLELTGVQVEVGDTATEFEHRSYGDELSRCQRYYQTVPDSILTSGYGTDSGYSRGSHIYVQTMRASPTLTITETSTGSKIAQATSKDGFYATFDGLGETGASLFNFIATAEL